MYKLGIAPPPRKSSYLLTLLLVGASFAFVSCSSDFLSENSQEIVKSNEAEDKAKAVQNEIASLTRQFIQVHGLLNFENAAAFEKYVAANASSDLKAVLPHFSFAKEQKPLLKPYDLQVSTSRMVKNQRVVDVSSREKNDPKVAFTPGAEVTVGNISGPGQIFLDQAEVLYTGMIGSVVYSLTYNPPSPVFSDVINARLTINNPVLPPGGTFFLSDVGPSQTWYGVKDGQPAVFVQFTMPTWVKPPAEYYGYVQPSFLWIVYEYVRAVYPIQSFVGINSSLSVSISYGGSSGSMTTTMAAQ